MNKEREYTREDMEELGAVINELKLIAHQLDQDIASGRISHEYWEDAAHDLMERKKEIEAILQDVDRYESDLREEIAHERRLRLVAEAKLSMLEAKAAKNNN